MIAENKQQMKNCTPNSTYKLNKEYWEILHISTIAWAQESLKSELVWESYEDLKLKDLFVNN
jgi:hypothetical protein